MKLSDTGLNSRKLPCVCDSCGVFFVRRMDYSRFDLCLSCSNKERGVRSRTHGDNNNNSKLHVVWNNMLNRCRNPNNKRFKHYGGRGIAVCEEWLDYKKFRSWSLCNGWSDDLTIDRIDVDLGYSPDNCRFVDKSVQNANRGLLRTNSSGFTGIWWAKGAYNARLIYKGNVLNLGRFGTMTAAVHARDEKIKEMGWPNQLSGIEKYTIDDLKEIEKEYREKIKKLAQ